MINFTREVAWILGRPNFWCGPIAHQLNRLGLAKIPPKAEEEQAYVIHWCLCLEEQYGDKWKVEADKILTGGLRSQSDTAEKQ